MFQDVVKVLLKIISPALNSQFRPLALVLLGTAILATALLLWRLWTFSIRPLLYPDEPKEVPYWIPCHAISFLKDEGGTLSYGREYFNGSREPFSITLAGEKIYILSDPEDVSTAYKNRTTLTFDPVIKDLMSAIGVSTNGVADLYKQPTEKNPIFDSSISCHNPQLKCLVHFQRNLYHHEMSPGEKYDILQERFLGLIDRAMSTENMAQDMVFMSGSNDMLLSLRKSTQRVLTTTGTTAFFGEKLLQLDPDFLQNFADFDDNNWMLWYNWPNASPMRTPKAKVLRTLERYLSLPKEERLGAAWIIDKLEDSQRQLGMKVEDIAAVMMTLQWVINTNTWKVSFWVLSYILFSSDKTEQIRAETASSILSNGSIDVPRLMASSPHLESLWNEVLRFTLSSAAVRTVLQPTPIGGKILQPGHRVMSPFRQLHFNEEIFGHDVDTCDPDRFFRKNSLARDPSFQPFGGGSTLCPGRFIARQEVFTFVALFLHRFDAEIVPANDAAKGARPFPKLDVKKPTTAVMGPQPGEDVILRIKKIDSEKTGIVAS